MLIELYREKETVIAASKDPYTKIYSRNVEKFNALKNDRGKGILSIETGETNGK